MSATCRVATLLAKFDRAVARFNELDALREKPRRGGLTAAQLKRKIDAAWFSIRRLETKATDLLATSEPGVTLQAVLAIAEADTVHSWALHELEENIAYRRLQRALCSIVLSRDLTVLDPETVRFYVGSPDRGPFKYLRDNTAKAGKRAPDVSSDETRRTAKCQKRK